MGRVQRLMRKVEIKDYDRAWIQRFLDEKEILEKILPNNVIIHHIGSTSVEGLAAKPIIDILVEVLSLADIDLKAQKLNENGYVGRGENGIANRRYFYKLDEDGNRLAHVHIFPAGSDNVIRHVAFRDYLRNYPQQAAEYSKIKQELAEKHPMDIEAYIDGKDSFVKELEKVAVNWYTSKKRER
jgi:GrpB-like predicted nucleotidyltransferase (UPF0157 family)